MADLRHLENRHDVNFLCRGRSDLDKISQTSAEVILYGRNRNQKQNSNMTYVLANPMACHLRATCRVKAFHPPYYYYTYIYNARTFSSGILNQRRSP